MQSFEAGKESQTEGMVRRITTTNGDQKPSSRQKDRLRNCVRDLPPWFIIFRSVILTRCLAKRRTVSYFESPAERGQRAVIFEMGLIQPNATSIITIWLHQAD